MGIRDSLSRLGSRIKQRVSRGINSLKRVGKKIIKAGSNAVNFVYKAAESGLKTIVNGVNSILEKTVNLGNKALDSAKNFLQNFDKVVNNLPRQIDELLKKLGDAFGNQQAEVSPDSQTGKQQEAELGKEDQGVIFSRIFRTMTNMVRKANFIFKQKQFQSFEDFSRLMVSIHFLKNIIKKLTAFGNVNTIETDQYDFINKINQFLNEGMTDTDLKAFDEAVKTHLGQDLLAMGSEQYFLIHTHEMMDRNNSLLNAQEENEMIIRKIRVLEIQKVNEGLNAEETGRLSELKKRRDAFPTIEKQMRQDLIMIRNIIGAAEGLIQIYKDKKLQKLYEEKLENVLDILVQWQNGITPSGQNAEILESFANAFRYDATQRVKSLQKEIEVEI